MQEKDPSKPVSETAGEATRLLASLASGDRPAQEELLQLVHAELQGLARGAMRAERGDHTLQATALMHEAWMRLVGQDQVDWQGRGHFLAVASVAMRRVLVDHARSRGRLKRRASGQRQPLDSKIIDPAGESTSPVDILDLHEGLQALGKHSERAARVVELRFFGGVSEEEAAGILGVSRPTVARDWRAAQAWLADRMKGGDFNG